MTDAKPPTTMTIQNARANLPDLINRVAYGKERIVLTRHGKPMVVVVPLEAPLVSEGDQHGGI